MNNERLISPHRKSKWRLFSHAYRITRKIGFAEVGITKASGKEQRDLVLYDLPQFVNVTGER